MATASSIKTITACGGRILGRRCRPWGRAEGRRSRRTATQMPRVEDRSFPRNNESAPGFAGRYADGFSMPNRPLPIRWPSHRQRRSLSVRR